MVDFIQNNKVLYGVEAICKILPISPSTYYRQLDLTENPEKRSKRDLHDQYYAKQIKRIWQESAGRYGIRKVWQQLKQEGYSVARCTVSRLMQQLEIQEALLRKGSRAKCVSGPWGVRTGCLLAHCTVVRERRTS